MRTLPGHVLDWLMSIANKKQVVCCQHCMHLSKTLHLRVPPEVCPVSVLLIILDKRVL